MHLFVDNLTNVDFSYLDPERGLLGETWLASTVLDGRLDEQGMVCDFGVVKKTLRDWLDLELDHRLAIPIRSKHLDWQKNGDSIDLEWRFGDNQVIACTAPCEAIALVDADVITPSNTSRWCIEQLQQLLPNSIDKLELDFSCEEINSDFYHYSHGLKKHDGNCQRIAHGHRSKLLIWRNDQRDYTLEQQWCESFRDIYIGSQEDVTTQNQNTFTFSYHTNQGYFELSIPKSCCYMIDTDTTVELIASHLANQLKKQNPSDRITVKAFEGIGKGSIVKRV